MTKAKTYERIDYKKIINKYSTILILLFMVILMTLLRPERFFAAANLKNILRQMSVIGVLSMGVSLCIITGGTDLSGGSNIALSACVVGLLVQKTGNIPIPIAILIAIIVGAFIGLLNGLVVSYCNVAPFIATLGMDQVARGLALLITNGQPVANFRPKFEFLGVGSLLGIPIPVIIFLILAVFVYLLLHRSRFGSHIYAIGGSEMAALVSGINTKKSKTLVYVTAGILAAIAGVMLAARTCAALSSYGEGYNMDAITCAVIGGVSFSGGKGSVGGIIVGILILGILTNGMTMMMVDPNWQNIAKGVVILIAVIIDQTKERRT